MRIKIIVFILILPLIVSKVTAQLWTLGTVYTIPQRKVETGIFSPFRYGITRTLEIQTFWEANYKIPNFTLKKYWGKIFWDIHLASKHGIYYPTPMIRHPVFTGTFSLPDSFRQAAPIIAYRNELLLSKFLIKKTSCTAANNLLILKLGIAAVWVLGDTALVPKYTKHLLYTRTSIFKKHPLWYIGLDLVGHLGEKLDYYTDIEFQSVDWKTDYWGIEHKFGIIYPLSEKLRFTVGYKLASGNYPATSLIFFSPTLDLIFNFEAVRHPQKGLFRHKMF